MARGQRPRPHSGCVTTGQRRRDELAEAAAAQIANGDALRHHLPLSPSKMVQGIAVDESKDGQRVHGYTLQNYTTIQITNRLRPPPGYPDDYSHDPASPLPPPGYPSSCASRTVQVVPDGRGSVTASVITNQPSVDTTNTRLVIDQSSTNQKSDTAPTRNGESVKPSSLSSSGRRAFVPPGILGEAYSTDPPVNGFKSGCTTPGSYSDEWNYEFVHEKTYAYIEAVKNQLGFDGGKDNFTLSHIDLNKASSADNVDHHSNEIHEYLDDEVLVNALTRERLRYGSVKETKKKNRGAKKLWTESRLLNSSSSDEKEKSLTPVEAASRADGVANDAAVSATNNRELGQEKNASPSSHHRDDVEATRRNLGKKTTSASKLTGILSRLSPKLVHRRCSSSGRILIAASDPAMMKSHRDSESTAAEISTSGVSSDVSTERDSSRRGEESPADSRRGRSPVRDFFKRGLSSAYAKSKSPSSANRILTSFRSSGAHKDKEFPTESAPSNSGSKATTPESGSKTTPESGAKTSRRNSGAENRKSTSSQFPLPRRRRKSKDETKELNSICGADPGDGKDGRASKNGSHGKDGRASEAKSAKDVNGSAGVTVRQKIRQNEGAILISSGGGRKYHVVEIPLDDDETTTSAAAADVSVEDENPEEEEAPPPPPSRPRKPRVPPPLPPHGLGTGEAKQPGSLDLHRSSNQRFVVADSIKKSPMSTNPQDESIGDCSLDMNTSAGSTTVADESLDFDDDDDRRVEFFGSQATLEALSASRQLGDAATGSPAHPAGRTPLTGAALAALGSAPRGHSMVNSAAAGAEAATSTPASDALSPLSPLSSSFCSSSLSSQPIPVPSSSRQGSAFDAYDENSISSSVIASPLGGTLHRSINSNSIGSPPSEATMDRSSTSASTSSSRKPSYLSISMSVSGYSHYRRGGASSLSLHPGRTTSSSSLASRGSGSVASGSSAFSHSTNEASHAGSHHSRTRELSGGGGWRAGSVPPASAAARPSAATESEAASTAAVPFSSCLMDRFCLGCGSASPPAPATSTTRSRLDPHHQQPFLQREPTGRTAATTTATVVKRTFNREGPNNNNNAAGLTRHDNNASSSSSSSNSSSSRRGGAGGGGGGDLFATQQRNTVIHVSPDASRDEEDSGERPVAGGSAGRSGGDADVLSDGTIVSSASRTEVDEEFEGSRTGEELTSPEMEGGGGTRQSVEVEAREIVERIKRSERLRKEGGKEEKEEGMKEKRRSKTLEEKQTQRREKVVREERVGEKENGESEEDRRTNEGTSESKSNGSSTPPPSMEPSTDDSTSTRPPINGLDGKGDADSIPVSVVAAEEKTDESATRDGLYFLDAMRHEEDRIQDLCSQLDSLLVSDLNSSSSSSSSSPHTNSASITAVPEEVAGKIRACVGKSKLLTTKKFPQFKGLCEENLHPAADAPFPTTADDLAGFWDMVMIQVDEIDASYKEIMTLKSNSWKSEGGKKKVVKRVVKSGSKSSAAAASTESPAAAAAAAARAKAREEARKKLVSSKRLLQNKRSQLQEMEQKSN